MRLRDSPWLPRLAALAAGLAAAFAHPPWGVLPGLLGYALLMWLVDRAGKRPLRSAFFRSWLAGVGYFAVGVWWVAEAFLVDAKTYGWMAPFALVMLAGGLALFWGLAALLYRLVRPQGVWRVLAFAGAFAALEWVRGHIFTGFPWNLPGETWRAGSAPSQAAAAVGAYGLTWITLAIAASPAVVLDRGRAKPDFTAPALGLAALVALYAAGYVRLSTVATTPLGPQIRIVQANIDQKEKWRPENLDAVFEAYADLTRRPGAPAIVVWPEGALPAVIDELLAPGSPYVPRLAATLRPGQILIMGANRVDFGPKGDARYYNSLVALRRAPAGFEVLGVYDKHRLVPFGEYLPLGSLATKIGFRSLVHVPEDFTAGPPPRPLAAPGLPPLQPLICYEALFPRLAVAGQKAAGVRPRWLANLSNDAWFGPTSGPRQHLNLASYRAIEEGVPIVRATPTGVSAMVDAFGRTEQRLEPGRYGVIDARLPQALAPTLYSRLGEVTFALMLAASGLACLFRRKA